MEPGQHATGIVCRQRGITVNIPPSESVRVDIRMADYLPGVLAGENAFAAKVTVDGKFTWRVGAKLEYAALPFASGSEVPLMQHQIVGKHGTDRLFVHAMSSEPSDLTAYPSTLKIALANPRASLPHLGGEDAMRHLVLANALRVVGADRGTMQRALDRERVVGKRQVSGTTTAYLVQGTASEQLASHHGVPLGATSKRSVSKQGTEVDVVQTVDGTDEGLKKALDHMHALAGDTRTYHGDMVLTLSNTSAMPIMGTLEIDVYFAIVGPLSPLQCSNEFGHVKFAPTQFVDDAALDGMLAQASTPNRAFERYDEKSDGHSWFRADPPEQKDAAAAAPAPASSEGTTEDTEVLMLAGEDEET
jgi:hypothetical protein